MRGLSKRLFHGPRTLPYIRKGAMRNRGSAQADNLICQICHIAALDEERLGYFFLRSFLLAPVHQTAVIRVLFRPSGAQFVQVKGSCN